VCAESVLCPTNIRETLAKVLVCDFEVSSVFFVPSHLVVLATLSQETALVVDIGYKEAVVIPVYSRVQVLNVWQAQLLAAEVVHDDLNGVKEELLTESIVEDIEARCCFVTSFEGATKHRNKEAVTPVPVPVEYPIKGKEVCVARMRL
jgi:actin-related protein 10